MDKLPPITFETASLDAKLLVFEALQTELAAKGFPNVRVLKSDPAAQSEIPCVGINRASDDETNQSIRDALGEEYSVDSKIHRTQQGTYFSEALEIRVWHTNAGERDRLYQFVKAVLFAYRLTWVEAGLLNLSLRAGRDEQDSSTTNAAVPLYWAAITMTYLNPLNVDLLTTVEPISGFTDNSALTTEGG